MKLQHKQIPEQKQILSQKMAMGMRILELPIEELEHFLSDLIEQNPLLEMPFSNRYFSPITQDPMAHISLNEHLLQQARLSFFDPKDLSIAETIIFNLDDEKYLDPTIVKKIADQSSYSLEKIQEILDKIHHFDPPGMGTKNLQERLLIQLDRQQQKIAYSIIHDHFEDFLHQRWNKLQKVYSLSKQSFQHICSQDLFSLIIHPHKTFAEENRGYIPKADIEIVEENNQWKYTVLDSSLFSFYFKMEYLKNRQKNRSFFHKYISSACFYKKSLLQRREILQKITQYILNEQKGFFFYREELKPLTLKQAALDLGYNYSTIYRAVSHKFVSIEGRYFPLIQFFPAPMASEISKEKTKTLIKKLIAKENKSKPFSDSAIQKYLEEKGICCARRTVSKYRKQMTISAAYLRKQTLTH